MAMILHPQDEDVGSDDDADPIEQQLSSVLYPKFVEEQAKRQEEVRLRRVLALFLPCMLACIGHCSRDQRALRSVHAQPEPTPCLWL